MANDDLHPILRDIQQKIVSVRDDLKTIIGKIDGVQETIQNGVEQILEAINDNIQAQAELKLMDKVASVRAIPAHIEAEREQVEAEKRELEAKLDSIGDRYADRHRELDEKATERIRDLGSHIFEIQEDEYEDSIEGPFHDHVTETWQQMQLDNAEIGSLQSLAGDPMENVAHADPSSNSGNLAPRALFANLGVVPEEDYSVSYSGGHQQSSLGVANGDYEAAPVCSTCYARVARDDQLDPTQIKCIWASEPFPTTAFCHVNTLHPDIQEGVRAAFLDYDYQDTAIAEEFEGRGTWVEIDYATVWDIILQIQESLEVDYETGNISEE